MQVKAINFNNNIINFRAKKPISLAEKYNINVENLPVIKSDNIKINDEEKALLVEKLIEAPELAKKNFNYGNIAKGAYSTNIGLKNGIWHVATNFNNTRNNISAICGERSAILGAYNDLLKTKDIENQNNNPLDFDVKYIAMSSYKPIGTDKNASSPCAECLSWFNTNRYFSDDTIVASFDMQDNQLALKLTHLVDYLPLRNETNTVSVQDVTTLPIKLSKKAKQSIEEKGLKKQEIIDLISTTQDKYNKNEQTNISGQNIATGIISNKQTFVGTKTDFTKRWYIDPLEIATSKAVETFGDNTKIEAICYLGESTFTDKYGQNHNDGVVNIKVLGELLERFADRSTLIITSTKDNIEIRTVDDYMPDNFRYHPIYK